MSQFNTPIFDTSSFDNLQPGTLEYEAAKRKAAQKKGLFNFGEGMYDPGQGQPSTMSRPNEGLFAAQKPTTTNVPYASAASEPRDRSSAPDTTVASVADSSKPSATTPAAPPAGPPSYPPPSTAAQPTDYKDTFSSDDSKILVYQDKRAALIKQLNETKDPEARKELHNQLNQIETAIKKVHSNRARIAQEERRAESQAKQDEKTASKRMDVRGIIAAEKNISGANVTDEEIDNYIAAEQVKKKAESKAKLDAAAAAWKPGNPEYDALQAQEAQKQKDIAAMQTGKNVDSLRNEYDQKLYALFANKIITQDDLNRKLREEPNYPALDALFGQLTGTFTNSGAGNNPNGQFSGKFTPPTDTTATPRPGDTQAPTSRGPDRPLRPLQEGGGLAPIPEGQTTAQAQVIGTPGERMAENERNIAANKRKNEEAARQTKRTVLSNQLTGPVNPDYVDGKGVDTRDTETGGQQGMENATSVEDFIYGLLNDPTGVGSDLKPQAPWGAKQAKQDKDAKFKADIAKLKKQKEDAEKDQDNALFNAATKQEAYRKKLK